LKPLELGLRDRVVDESDDMLSIEADEPDEELVASGGGPRAEVDPELEELDELDELDDDENSAPLGAGDNDLSEVLSSSSDMGTA
jgi:hypothetical protein